MNAVLYRASLAARAVRISEIRARPTSPLVDSAKEQKQGLAEKPIQRIWTEIDYLRAENEMLRAKIKSLIDPFTGLPIKTPKAIEIIHFVSRQYDMPVNDIMSACRRNHIVYVRHIAMYLVKLITMLSFPQVGRVFADRDHTSILYAFGKVSKKRKNDPAFDAELKEIETHFKYDADAYPRRVLRR